MKSMADVNALGSLIQEYVRLKMLPPDQRPSVPPSLQSIDAGLRLRVDVLGFDSERLLEVPAHEVLARLENLEYAAQREDAGYEPTGTSELGGRRSFYRTVSRPSSNYRVRSKR